LRFGRFELDRHAGVLRRGAESVHLRPRTFALLGYLAERPDTVVTKDELLEALWPDRIVADAAVKNCVRELRRALDDDPATPAYIKTVHRVGYRFVAPVETDPEIFDELSADAAPLDKVDAALRLTAETQLAVALSETRGWGAKETGNAYERARRLSDVTGQTVQRFPVLWGQSAFLILRGQYDEARAMAKEFMDEAEIAGASDSLVEAHLALGTCQTWIGQFEAANEQFAAGLKLYNPAIRDEYVNTYGQDPKATMLAIGALALWALGSPADARAQSDAALAWSTEIGHPYTLAMVSSFTAMLAQLDNDTGRTAASARAAVDLARRHGFPLWHGMGQILHGWAVCASGDTGTGLEYLDHGTRTWRATGARWGAAYFAGLVADAYRAADKLPIALQTLEEAETAMEQTGEHFCAAEIYRLHAEMAGARTSLADIACRNETMRLYDRAMAAATSQAAPAFQERVRDSRREHLATS
jgi:adenylate cyclase